MKENSEKDALMELELSTLEIIGNIKESGKIIKCMDLGSSLGLMENSMKENSLMIKKKALVSFIHIKKSTWECGKIHYLMDMLLSLASFAMSTSLILSLISSTEASLSRPTSFPRPRMNCSFCLFCVRSSAKA